MREPTLFDPPRARASDPDTSHMAAESMRAVAQSQCARVLDRVRCLPGLTYQQLAAALGLAPVAVMRRLGDLQRDGLVRKGPAVKDDSTGRSMSTWYEVMPTN